MRAPVDPYDFAPCSARRVESDFVVTPRGNAFSVRQRITWKDCDGDWSGDFIILAEGISEAKARRIQAELTEGTEKTERRAA